MRQLTKTELDSLPLVDRSLVFRGDEASVAAVWRTRGCPNRCDFCEVCEIYPRCVRRSDERALAELVAGERLGYRTAFLIDDNAAADKPAFMGFLRGMAEHGYARTLVTQLRADSVFRKEGGIDWEFLRLLKRAAAVTVVCVGVESAEDENLEAIHKNVDSTRMAEALSAMKRAGILVHGMFIALADDTRETVKRNGDYAKKYVTSLQYLFETPLPGTKRTRQHEAGGTLLFGRPEDLALYDGMHCVLRPQNMSATEMQRLVEREYRRFYSLGRVFATALQGAFLRFRILTREQRAALRELPRGRRLSAWTRFHLEYKFAPVAFLAIGRSRMREQLTDPQYLAFLGRLRARKVSGGGVPGPS